MMLHTLDSTHINHIWCKPKSTFRSLQSFSIYSPYKNYDHAFLAPYTLPHSIHIQSHQSAYLYIPIILYHCSHFWTSTKFLLYTTSLYYKYIIISLSHLRTFYTNSYRISYDSVYLNSNLQIHICNICVFIPYYSAFSLRPF